MTLFVDMDEVLADTYQAHLDLYNSEYNEQLKVENCLGRELWQCVPADRQASIREHCHRPGFFKGLKPMKDAIEVMEQLSQEYQVYIASAAMEFPVSLAEKSEWIDEHMPFIPWKQRILCGHKHILRGEILIDDRLKNLQPFVGRSILFTSPHNTEVDGFERVSSWAEIAEKLL